MASLVFVTDTDGRSGRVASRKAQTTIRAHVMRKHGSEKSGLRNSIAKGGNKGTIPHEDYHEDNLPEARNAEAVALCADWSSDSARSMSALTDNATNTASKDLNTSWYLNRIVDDFVYAGSCTNTQSYGYFHHSASECVGSPLQLHKTLC